MVSETACENPNKDLAQSIIWNLLLSSAQRQHIWMFRAADLLQETQGKVPYIRVYFALAFLLTDRQVLSGQPTCNWNKIRESFFFTVHIFV